MRRVLLLVAGLVVVTAVLPMASSGANTEQQRVEAFQRDVANLRQTCCHGATSRADWARRYFRTYREVADKHGGKLDLFFDAYAGYVVALAEHVDHGMLTTTDLSTITAEFGAALRQERERFHYDLRRRLSNAAEENAPGETPALVLEKALIQERRRLDALAQRDPAEWLKAARERALELERRQAREAAEHEARAKALEVGRRRAAEAAQQQELRRVEQEVARLREKVRELEQERSAQQQREALAQQQREALAEQQREARQRNDEALSLLLLQQAMREQRRESDSLDVYLNAQSLAWQTGFWSSFWSNMIRPQVQCRTIDVGGYARTTCN